ncbi:unnamed protein product, partial [marine sediment metagenome]
LITSLAWAQPFLTILNQLDKLLDIHILLNSGIALWKSNLA